MNEKEVRRKLAAILSADVKGYSRLMEEDEVATIRTLTSYRELMTTLIRKHRGRVVDSPGDNLLAEFGSVVDGVRCAVEIQEELRVRNAELPENRRMVFRIGINLGDVVEEGERIYGDGVNIAARVEGLAEGGGICISGTVYDSIKNKLSLSYESIGEHTVKNITEPVRVYRMRIGPEASAPLVKDEKVGPRRWRWAALAAMVVIVVVAGGAAIWNFYFRHPSVEPASVEKMAYPLPDKPSIAVLPFDKMSEDPKQEYFCDGLSEEIITALSKVPNMFVIARNTTFTYKGKPVKVKQVAEELGVRYVLEGSVRRAGDRVRITAQLIDALKGDHLWAERYDRAMKDIFALQDEITMKIITAMRVKLTEGEIARIAAKGTDNLDAYLKCSQGIKHFMRFNPDDHILARRYFEEAIALDPEYADPYVFIGNIHLAEVRHGWSKSPQESLEHAFMLAQKVFSLDKSQVGGHILLGRIHMIKRQHEKAIAAFERALALEPNGPGSLFMLGNALSFAGRPQEAIPHFKKLIRLNPLDPSLGLNGLGIAYIRMERYEEAITVCKKAIHYNPNYFRAHVILTACYAALGREEEALAEAAEVLRINPKFSLEKFAENLQIKDKVVRARYIDALRKAGLPESPPLPLPDKPSIAVLPFTNMSDDPKQEYFSDGLTEEIISALSRVPKLFVIARNSTFTYKGKPVKVQQVSKELGVRYVLEGSVRKAGDRVRITAQLIDTTTGHHLWAERYDRELWDIFALQDEITMKIITAMQVKLTEGERARVYEKGTDNLDAYINFLQGRNHYHGNNPDDDVLARRYLEEAISVDPEFAPPYVFMASIHLMEVRRGLSKSPQRSIGKAFELAQKALALDESYFGGHMLLGQIHLINRQYENAIAACERAVAVDPNATGSLFWLGTVLSNAGRHQEAISHFKRAIRLNPLDPSFGLFGLGFAYMHMERYEEAITVLKKVLYYRPDFLAAHIRLACCYAALGREEEAHAEAAEVLRLNPKFSVKKHAKASAIRDKSVKERYIDALRKAGLPD